MLGDVELVAFDAAPVTRGCALDLARQPGHAPHRVQRQLVAVQVVQHHHVEGRGGGALLLEAPHMEVGMVVAAVGQPVHQRRVAMEGKNHRAVGGEQGVEIPVVQAMRVFGLRLQDHQVDHVDDTDADAGHIVAQQHYRCQRLQRGHVAGTRHHHIGRLVAGGVFGTGPVPHAGAGRAVAHGSVHVQPLPRRLLASHDDIDIVAAAQAMVGHRQQAVGVGRQVDAHHIGRLVGHMVHKARVLVRQAVVVLPPDMRGEQNVQRRNGCTPRDLAADFQPFGMLVEHRIDDVDEGLVAREQAMAPGQQVALQPAFAQVLAQHLHHAAFGAEVGVVCHRLGHPGFA